MRPPSPNHPAEYYQCFMDDMGKSEFNSVKNMRSTIGVDGFYEYDDGFGDIETKALCFRYLPFVTTKTHGIFGSAQLVDCDNFPRMIQLLKDELAAEH